jgi:hypothetical protein
MTMGTQYLKHFYPHKHAMYKPNGYFTGYPPALKLCFVLKASSMAT